MKSQRLAEWVVRSLYAKNSRTLRFQNAFCDNLIDCAACNEVRIELHERCRPEAPAAVRALNFLADIRCFDAHKAPEKRSYAATSSSRNENTFTVRSLSHDFSRLHWLDVSAFRQFMARRTMSAVNANRPQMFHARCARSLRRRATSRLMCTVESRSLQRLSNHLDPTDIAEMPTNRLQRLRPLSKCLP